MCYTKAFVKLLGEETKTKQKNPNKQNLLKSKYYFPFTKDRYSIQINFSKRGELIVYITANPGVSVTVGSR